MYIINNYSYYYYLYTPKKIVLLYVYLARVVQFFCEHFTRSCHTNFQLPPTNVSRSTVVTVKKILRARPEARQHYKFLDATNLAAISSMLNKKIYLFHNITVTTTSCRRTKPKTKFIHSSNCSRVKAIKKNRNPKE